MEDAILENSKGATYMSFVLDIEIVIKKEGRVNVAETKAKSQVSNKGDKKDIPKNPNVEVYAASIQPHTMKSIFDLPLNFHQSSTQPHKKSTNSKKRKYKSIFDFSIFSDQESSTDSIKQSKNIQNLNKTTKTKQKGPIGIKVIKYASKKLKNKSNKTKPQNILSTLKNKEKEPQYFTNKQHEDNFPKKDVEIKKQDIEFYPNKEESILNKESKQLPEPKIGGKIYSEKNAPLNSSETLVDTEKDVQHSYKKEEEKNQFNKKKPKNILSILNNKEKESSLKTKHFTNTHKYDTHSFPNNDVVNKKPDINCPLNKEGIIFNKENQQLGKEKSTEKFYIGKNNTSNGSECTVQAEKDVLHSYKKEEKTGDKCDMPIYTKVDLIKPCEIEETIVNENICDKYEVILDKENVPENVRELLKQSEGRKVRKKINTPINVNTDENLFHEARERKKFDKKAKVFRGKLEQVDFLECNRIFMCNFLKPVHYRNEKRKTFFNKKPNSFRVDKVQSEIETSKYDEISMQKLYSRKIIPRKLFSYWRENSSKDFTQTLQANSSFDITKSLGDHDINEVCVTESNQQNKLANKFKKSTRSMKKSQNLIGDNFFKNEYFHKVNLKGGLSKTCTSAPVIKNNFSIKSVKSSYSTKKDLEKVTLNEKNRPNGLSSLQMIFFNETSKKSSSKKYIVEFPNTKPNPNKNCKLKEEKLSDGLATLGFGSNEGCVEFKTCYPKPSSLQPQVQISNEYLERSNVFDKNSYTCKEENFASENSKTTEHVDFGTNETSECIENILYSNLAIETQARISTLKNKVSRHEGEIGNDNNINRNTEFNVIDRNKNSDYCTINTVQSVLINGAHIDKTCNYSDSVRKPHSVRGTCYVGSEFNETTGQTDAVDKNTSSKIMGNTLNLDLTNSIHYDNIFDTSSEKRSVREDKMKTNETGRKTKIINPKKYVLKKIQCYQEKWKKLKKI